MHTLEGACFSAPPDGRLDVCLAALLDWVAADSVFAWALFVETFGGTPMRQRRYLETVARATDLLAEVMPEEIREHRVIVESLACGVIAVIGRLLREGERQGIQALHAELLTFLTLPSWSSPRPDDGGG